MNKNEYQRQWNNIYDIYSKNDYMELPWINNDNLSDFKSLIESLELGTNSNIIDIGCGTGKIANYLSQIGKVYAIDISNNEIERCQNRYKNNKNLIFETKNILDIDTRQKYDLVVAHLLLHEIQLEHIDIVCKNIASLVSENGYILLSWLKQDSDYTAPMRPCLYTQERFYVYYYKKEFVTKKFPSFYIKDCPDIRIKTSDVVLGYARKKNVKGFTYQTLLMQKESKEISSQKFYQVILKGFSALKDEVKSRIITSEYKLEIASKSIFENLSILIFKYLSLNGNIKNANVFLNIQMDDFFRTRESERGLLFTSLNKFINKSVLSNCESRANILVENYHKYFNKSDKKKFLIHDFFDYNNNDLSAEDIKLLDLYLGEKRVCIKREFFNSAKEEPNVYLSDFFNELNHKKKHEYNIEKYIEYAELLFNCTSKSNQFSIWLKNKKINIPIDVPYHYTVWNLSFPYYNYIGTIIVESFDDNIYPEIPSYCLDEIRNVFHAFKIEFQKVENELAKFRIQTEAIKSAKAAIMSRNMSHNLGSHYIANTKNYISNLANVKNDSDLRGLTHLLQYIQERMDYIATVISNDVYPLGALNIKSQFFDELTIDDCGERHGERYITTNFLLKYIVFSEKYSRVNTDNSKLKNLRIEINYPEVVSKNSEKKTDRIFTGKKSCKEIEESLKLELSKLNIAVPCGIMARHALFNIIENIIRNSAKHNKENSESELVIRLTLKEVDRESLKISIHDNRGGYDSLIGEYKDGVIANRLKELRFLEADGSLNKNNKGLKEMIISALWLKNKDVGEVMTRIDSATDGEEKYKIITQECLCIERSTDGHLSYVLVLPIYQKVMSIKDYLNDRKTLLTKLNNIYADVVTGPSKESDKLEKSFDDIFPRYLVEDEKVEVMSSVEKLKNTICQNLHISMDDFDKYTIHIDKVVTGDPYKDIEGVENIMPETPIDKQICFITHFDTQNDNQKKETLEKYKQLAYLDSISGENFTSTLVSPDFLRDEYLKCKVIESALTKIAIIDERIYEKFAPNEKAEQLSVLNELQKDVSDKNIQSVQELISLIENYYSSMFAEEKLVIKQLLEEKDPLSAHLEENDVNSALNILCPVGLQQNVLDKRGIYVYTIETNPKGDNIIKDISGRTTKLGSDIPLQKVLFLTIHLGLIERCKNEGGVKDLMEDIKIHFPAVKYIAIHSGRGNYSADLSLDLKDYCFITLSALEAAINNSKYMLSQLFYNMNYYGKGNINND